MRAKLTLVRDEGRRTDLVIGADATATVGDAARALFLGDPLKRGTEAPAGLTLRVGEGTSGRTLDPAADLAEAGVRSGSTAELVVYSDGYRVPGESRGPAAAVLRVIEGPDAGAEFPLPSGTSTVGRDRDVDVRLSDPLVSKRHCRVNIGPTIEVVDTDSANGVVIGGNRVGRSAVGAGDVLVLGDTSVVVAALHRDPESAASGAVEVMRSPRVVRRFPERELAHPKPPDRPTKGRFPLVAMIAPLAMGAVLWFATHQLLSLIFVALSPVLMIGTWVDQLVTARRTLASQRQAFETACVALDEEIDREHAVERAIRLSRHPSLADAVDAVERTGPLIWTHRPEHDEFLCLRLGTGMARSALSVKLPDEHSTLPDAWVRLTDLAARAAVVDGVPIVADLRSAGGLGVAGSGARQVAEGLVLQAATLHSPTELQIACIASGASRGEWEWLSWLPHLGNPSGPLGGLHLADNAGSGATLLERLEELVEVRLAAVGDRPGRGPIAGDGPEAVREPAVPSVLLVVEHGTPVSLPRLVRLAERGPDAGVHVIWVAPDVSAVPAACRSFVVAGDTSTVGEVRTGGLSHPVHVEPLATQDATRLARAMSAMVDAAALTEDDADLPRAVDYPALAAITDLEDVDGVVERWQEVESVTPRGGRPPAGKRKGGTLAALVGMGAAGPVTIDLRVHGPHALVGGTTGAGKSEFLQTWVMGMARANSPDRLAFLFVDYKGGAAFADCIDLPHTVGLVTDLSPHLVRRALTSLRAELRHREHLLNRKKVKDLATLERSWDPETPPSLVIVVDEFAALATEVPEFVDGVVDVAQRGRSLGLHLILATQRPAGVIKDNLRANTNLRVALRLADADDSTDVLGVPDAAHFDPTTPGRGAVKTGPGRIQAFQTGYVGGRTSSEKPPAQVEVSELGFSSVVWEAPRSARVEVSQDGPTDIARMVSAVRAAARKLEVPSPRKPWLPELAAAYDFARLPNPRTDARLVLGVLDRPEQQDQPVFAYEPDRDGNLAVYGTGGSGKSTVLRTVAVAAAATARGGPVQVYGLDFGSRGLRPLEVLPHVSAVVDGDDAEGVSRVLRRLRDLVDERATRFAAMRADSLDAYRSAANAPSEARVLLLVDGIAAFREAHEFSATPEFAMFAQIAADGRAVGVHLVVTGDRPNAVPMSVASTVQRRLVLRQATEDDYLMLGAPKDVLGPGSPPGRGLVGDSEVQVAVLGGSPNLAVQARELGRLAEAMQRHGVSEAPTVGRLAASISLADVPTPADGSVAIGIDDASLGPASFAPRGAFLLAGSPGSGRTTALATLAAVLGRDRSDLRVLLFTPRRSTLVGLPGQADAYVGADAACEGARRWADEIAAADGGPGPLAILIESIADFTGTAAEMDLERLVREAVRADHLVVGESETSMWGQAYVLSAPFKAARRGLLLVPGELDGDSLLSTPLGRFRRSEFPPGRGFLVERGSASKVQVALPT